MIYWKCLGAATRFLEVRKFQQTSLERRESSGSWNQKALLLSPRPSRLAVATCRANSAERCLVGQSTWNCFLDRNGLVKATSDISKTICDSLHSFSGTRTCFFSVLNWTEHRERWFGPSSREDGRALEHGTGADLWVADDASQWDLMRVVLLYNYGGAWMDSDVLLVQDWAVMMYNEFVNPAACSKNSATLNDEEVVFEAGRQMGWPSIMPLKNSLIACGHRFAVGAQSVGVSCVQAECSCVLRAGKERLRVVWQVGHPLALRLRQVWSVEGLSKAQSVEGPCEFVEAARHREGDHHRLKRRTAMWNRMMRVIGWWPGRTWRNATGHLSGMLERCQGSIWNRRSGPGTLPRILRRAPSELKGSPKRAEEGPKGREVWWSYGEVWWSKRRSDWRPFSR